MSEDYDVTVTEDGEQLWYQNGNLHRLDGPAMIHSNGDESYYLYGTRVDKEEFLNRDPCDGKVVEFDGKRYKLVAQ